MCTGAYRHTSTTSLLDELGWQPLRVRREAHKLTFLFKVVRSLVPTYMITMLPRPVENHTSSAADSMRLSQFLIIDCQVLEKL